MRNTRQMTLCALFAALCAACAQIQIPTQTAAMSLALLAVHLCGALLPPSQALTAMVVYLLMGALGLPVFSGFRGGIGVLLDRSGGYIIGYVACAWLGSRLMQGQSSPWRMLMAMGVRTLACYALGTAWFMVITSSPLWTSLTLCVIPFIPVDIAKIALAVLLTKRLRTPLRRLIK